jgi:hypothetical protein
MRDKILLLLWNCWHLRNDVIHNEGKETIANSCAFLQAYLHDVTSKPTCQAYSKGKEGDADYNNAAMSYAPKH